MEELTREPSGLDAVWALHRHTGPAPKQGLSAGRIAAAAIALADAEGLGAVSMGRVAKALGFTTMSLYRHLRSKDELILLMQDTAIGPPTEPDEPSSGWRAELEGWTWAVLGAFRRHPWILQTIPMFGPPATPNQLAWLERGLRALAPTGLSEAEKMSTMLLLDAHVFSDLMFAGAADATAPQEEGGPDYYLDLLRRVLDPEQFPALLQAARGGAFDGSDDPVADRDAGFAFGLARILDGVEHLMEQRAAR